LTTHDARAPQPASKGSRSGFEKRFRPLFPFRRGANGSGFVNIWYSRERRLARRSEGGGGSHTGEGQNGLHHGYKVVRKKRGLPNLKMTTTTVRFDLQMRRGHREWRVHQRHSLLCPPSSTTTVHRGLRIILLQHVCVGLLFFRVLFISRVSSTTSTQPNFVSCEEARAPKAKHNLSSAKSETQTQRWRRQKRRKIASWGPLVGLQ